MTLQIKTTLQFFCGIIIIIIIIIIMIIIFMSLLKAYNKCYMGFITVTSEKKTKKHAKTTS